jgi:hypothetical protein
MNKGSKKMWLDQEPAVGSLNEVMSRNSTNLGCKPTLSFAITNMFDDAVGENNF